MCGAIQRRQLFTNRYFMYEDKTLICKDCGQEFIFTAGEQEFYAEKGFTNEPQRCTACRDARKNSRKSNSGERQMFDAVCATCGKTCKVPFAPSGDRPVYCSDCFSKRYIFLRTTKAELFNSSAFA